MMSFTNPQRKESSGVISGDLGGQGIKPETAMTGKHAGTHSSYCGGHCTAIKEEKGGVTTIKCRLTRTKRA